MAFEIPAVSRLPAKDADSLIDRDRLGRIMFSGAFVVVIAIIAYLILEATMGVVLNKLMHVSLGEYRYRTQLGTVWIYRTASCAFLAICIAIAFWWANIKHFMVLNDHNTAAIAMDNAETALTINQENAKRNYVIFGPGPQFKYWWDDIETDFTFVLNTDLINNFTEDGDSKKEKKEQDYSFKSRRSEVYPKWKAVVRPHIVNAVNLMQTGIRDGNRFDKGISDAKEICEKSFNACLVGILPVLSDTDISTHADLISEMVSWCCGLPIDPNKQFPEEKAEHEGFLQGELEYLISEFTPDMEDDEYMGLSKDKVISDLRHTLIRLRNTHQLVQLTSGMIIESFSVIDVNFPKERQKSETITAILLDIARQTAMLSGIKITTKVETWMKKLNAAWQDPKQIPQLRANIELVARAHKIKGYMKIDVPPGGMNTALGAEMYQVLQKQNSDKASSGSGQ
jgi:hypothetical protein